MGALCSPWCFRGIFRGTQGCSCLQRSRGGDSSPWDMLESECHRANKALKTSVLPLCSLTALAQLRADLD